MYSDYNQWSAHNSYRPSIIENACIHALKREINSLFPSGHRAWERVKELVGDEANYMTYYDFCDLVRHKGLMPSYNRSFASMRDLNDFLWEVGGITLGNIGGIASATGLIRNLLNQPEAFSAEHYTFVFPFTMTASLREKFDQMKTELAEAFLRHKTHP